MKIIHTLIPFVVILTTVFIGGCKQEPQKTALSPPKVTVAKPVVQDVTNYIYFTGYCEAKESVELRARVEGFLDHIAFKSGTMVKNGDLLFRIDPKPFIAQVNQAKANLQISQAEAKLAEAGLKRKERAYKEKAVSEIAVLEARAQLSKARAEVKGAEAELNSTQLDLSYTRIHLRL